MYEPGELNMRCNSGWAAAHPVSGAAYLPNVQLVGKPFQLCRVRAASDGFVFCPLCIAGNPADPAGYSLQAAAPGSPVYDVPPGTYPPQMPGYVPTAPMMPPPGYAAPPGLCAAGVRRCEPA